jgi:hypothetical protein
MRLYQEYWTVDQVLKTLMNVQLKWIAKSANPKTTEWKEKASANVIARVTSQAKDLAY